MNLQEAYTMLELSSGASPEEAKKKYRELTKKFHPDVNKESDAEDKFKKINEAYQCIQNGKGNEREAPHARNPFRHGTQVIELENIELHLTIDFKESVLGCKKEIKYSRKAKCHECGGDGQTKLDNGCKKCHGKGQITFKQAGMVFVGTCPDCQGRAHTVDCKICHTQGIVSTDISIHVSVPAGVLNGNILRLQGMGNYAGSFMGFADQYTDAFCHVNVTPESGLTIDGKNVVTNITISLLEALRGCDKEVKTIHGLKGIKIPSKSKNHDQVIIPHHGVSGVGDQRIILDVQYPGNTDKLIEFLTNEVS